MTPANTDPLHAGLKAVAEMDEPNKVVRCKFCEQGNISRDGEHWVVKSISPARINIVSCKARGES